MLPYIRACAKPGNAILNETCLFSHDPYVLTVMGITQITQLFIFVVSITEKKIEILKADDPDSYSKVKDDGFKMTQKGDCTHGKAGMSPTDNCPGTWLCIPALEY